ncbi:MAG TPA: M20/M25/M40 family metallo-hydrolase, partial [Verrucomicrobiae bacterium]|nr:M20/M25/M40 family metallo-hydrolase [Verrucomicrobiae bacterium]
TNIVPDRCELQAEVRSLDAAKLRAQVEEMTAAMRGAAEEFGGSVDIATTPCYSAYSIPEDSPPARHAAGAARRVGAPPVFRSTGGGSDANIFNSRGFPSVVLGCGYERVHTPDERMSLSQLALLAEWVVALITEGSSQAEEHGEVTI